MKLREDSLIKSQNMDSSVLDTNIRIKFLMKGKLQYGVEHKTSA